MNIFKIIIRWFENLCTCSTYEYLDPYHIQFTTETWNR